MLRCAKVPSYASRDLVWHPGDNLSSSRMISHFRFEFATVVRQHVVLKSLSAFASFSIISPSELPHELVDVRKCIKPIFCFADAAK